MVDMPHLLISTVSVRRLIEIVSEPDLRSPEEATAYLEKIRAIMQYCDVSDVKMEEGSLRCDANISLRPFGQEKFGTRAELKNMNSFRGVQRGLEYEEYPPSGNSGQRRKSLFRKPAAGMKRKAKPYRCAAKKKRMITVISRIRIWLACISTMRGKQASELLSLSCRMRAKRDIAANMACQAMMRK